MKKQILKIAGVKSEKEFYKKFPTEEAFMAKHGKELKKAQFGDDLPQLSGEIMPTLGYNPTPLPYSPYGGAARLPRTQLGNVTQGASPAKTMTPSAKPTAAKGAGAAQYVQPALDVVQGLSMIKEQKQAVRRAKQMAQLTGVQSAAVASKPRQLLKRQYVRPEDVIVQPEQMFPSYGVGTNVLAQDGTVIGGNPTEIQNMYNPGTLYSDLGYEPLNDTSKIKQFVAGGKLTKAKFGNQNWMQDTQFGDFMMGGGDQVLDSLGMAIQGEPDAGTKIGKGIGSAAGTALGGPIGGMIGGFLGGALGDAFDTSEQQIRKYENQSSRNITNVVGQEIGTDLQNQFGLQNGGETSPYKWVSHTWQPQVITTFGEHKVKDLLKPPTDADMLRAGGHLKAYTPPSAAAMSTERPAMQMGGELQTHWGGYAETLSQNPYLPDGGETIMFRGQSHDESDGRGNTGIGITYGENPVEVERGEPAVKLQDGTTGDSNLTVFGNIKITNAFADMLGDTKAKGKKFKTYVADLSKQENKQNKLVEKSINQLDNLDVQSSFDKLALETLQANIEGANAKLKDLATKKMDAAALQNAINDTKEENLLEVTDKGDVLAKKGAKIPKAQPGILMFPSQRAVTNQEAQQIQKTNNLLNTLYSQPNKSLLPADMAREAQTTRVDGIPVTTLDLNEQPVSPAGPTARQRRVAASTDTYKSKYGLEPWKGNVKGLGLATASELDAREWDRVAETLGFTGRGNKQFQEFLLKNPKSKPLIEARHQALYGRTPSQDPNLIDSMLGAGWQGVAELIRPQTGTMPRTLRAIPPTTLPKPSPLPSKTVDPVVSKSLKGIDWMTTLNQVLPYLRPSDVEQLDPNQLIGEMYALANNQVEPVWAQKITPELSTPYDISLQDILNQNQADYNATQRLVGYNPAALGSLNAQKYAANQKVLGEQFRMNQAEKQRVYEQNRNLLNQANLQNLQTLERQADKQATALSKTKATTQEALNSIAAKYAQNKLENRTLATYENLYNYRFDPRFRAVNMNPLAQWDTEMNPLAGNRGAVAPEGYEFETVLKKKKKDTEKSRNGSIVKNLKNI